jgi:DNA polymerase-3 subunit alpha
VFDILDETGLAALQAEIGTGGDGTGEVLARVQIGDGKRQLICLGRNFALDGELAERLASAPGLANVALSARRGPARLKLVA